MSCRGCTGCEQGGAPAKLRCPHCGADRLFGPAVIIDDLGKQHRYYDCARCHTLALEDPATGELVARAGAW